MALSVQTKKNSEASHKASTVPEVQKAQNTPRQLGVPAYLQRKTFSSSVPMIQKKCLECEEDEEQEDVVQAKLTVGASNDDYEKEADQVADTVMRKPSTPINKAPLQNNKTTIQPKLDSSSSIRRLCNECEENIQKKDNTPAKANGTKGLAASNKAAKVIQSPGSGEPLSNNVRSRVEPVLNSDLSHARVHNDNRANEAAKSINAKAFTHNNNIFLGAGQSSNDIELMAHESTHVMQQTSSAQRKPISPGEGDTLQAKLEINATRQFEAPAMNASTGGVSNEDSGGESKAGQVEASTSETDAESAEGNALEVANNTEVTEETTETSTNTGGGEPACQGGGGLNAQKYEGGYEEPDEEPDKKPKNPPATKADEQMSSESTEAEENDDCPIEKAVGSESTAAEPPESELAAADAVSSEGGKEEGAKESTETAGATSGNESKDIAESEAALSPIETSIATTEVQRDEAVAAYASAENMLIQSGNQANQLSGSFTFSADENEEADSRKARLAASRKMDGYFSTASILIGDTVSKATDAIPDEIAILAESLKGHISNSIETEKASVSASAAVAREMAYMKAQEVSQLIYAEHDNTVLAMEAETSVAIEQLKKEQMASSILLNTHETTSLEKVSSLYATSRTAHIETGKTVGKQAVARGEEYYNAYAKFKINKDDGFWVGDLTDRRAKAQQNTARETAKGYKSKFEEIAGDQAKQAMKGRKKDRCGVIAAASRSRDTLDTQLDTLISALESSLSQSVSSAATTRDQLLTSVEKSLTATLNAIDQQEHSQRQAINDTGYLQQVTIEQVAFASVASIQTSVSQAIDSLVQVLLSIQSGLSSGPAPDAKQLEKIIARGSSALSAGMNQLEMALDQGGAQAQSKLMHTGNQALQALNNITASAIDGFGDLSNGFSETMSQAAEGASSTFALMREQFLQQVQSTVEGGIAGFAQIVSGYEQAMLTLTGNVETALNDSKQKLLDQLTASLNSLDCEIPKQATKAASKEQPSWKGWVAIILIIVVIIVVALVIGPAVIGAVGAAASALGAGAAAGTIGTLVGGAIVGALASGTIQIINNVAAGNDITQGLGSAMMWGAIGGFLGAGAGLIGQALGRSFAALSGQISQYALNIVGDAIVELGTEIAQGTLSWENFGKAMAMSLATAGFGEIPRVKRVQATVTYGSARRVPGASAAHLETVRPRTPAEIEAASTGTTSSRPTDADADLPPGLRSGSDTETSTVPKTETETTAPKTESETETTTAPKSETEDSASTKRNEPDETASTTTKNESESPPRRSSHEDSPEIEQGVVAKQELGDGHAVTVLKDGRVITCSSCGEVRMKYAQELADPRNIALKNKLDRIEAMTDPQAKLDATVKLRNDLEVLRSSGISRVPAGATDGAAIARLAGFPDAPNGYHWAKQGGGVVIKRNPGNLNKGFPKITYDGPTRKFVPLDTVTAPTLRGDFDTHITKVDTKPSGQYAIDKKGSIKGGHNADEFNKALLNPRGDHVPAIVTSRSPLMDASGKVIGETIKYRVPQIHGNGPNAGKSIVDSAGNVSYKPEQIKTVYDPRVTSDTAMINQLKSVGTEAYYSKIVEFMSSNRKNINFTYSKDGINYQVYLKKDAGGKPYLDNIHLE